MVANPGKFQMFLGSKIDNNKITFAIENKQIKCKRKVKLLGITIDENLTFTMHIANICSLINNRLRALTRTRRFKLTELTKCLSEVYTQQTFQRRLNVVFRLIWHRNVAQHQINVVYVKFTTFKNVEQRCVFQRWIKQRSTTS